jgi:hypothetical protein
MTLPPYTRSREGGVHELGLGQKKARALNGPVKPLQPKVRLVAHPVCCMLPRGEEDE